MKCPECDRKVELGQGVILTACGLILIAIALAGCNIRVYPIL